MDARAGKWRPKVAANARRDKALGHKAGARARGRERAPRPHLVDRMRWGGVCARCRAVALRARAGRSGPPEAP
eukprot:9919261-Alexandrium_andersonii.AAC.1